MAALDRRTFLAAAAAVLAGCSSTKSSQRAAGGNPLAPSTPTMSVRSAITSVVMVGDSITEASVAQLTAALGEAGVDDARIEGKASRRIEVGNGNGSNPLSGVGTVFSLLVGGVDPSAWVIALGTNDVGSYADADQYGMLIAAITDMLPPTKPLVWVNTYRQQYLDDTLLFNMVLADRMSARGNAVVADWYSVAAAPDQTVLRSDNLHPNDNGKNALALLVLAALQQL